MARHHGRHHASAPTAPLALRHHWPRHPSVPPSQHQPREGRCRRTKATGTRQRPRCSTAIETLPASTRRSSSSTTSKAQGSASTAGTATKGTARVCDTCTTAVPPAVACRRPPDRDHLQEGSASNAAMHQLRGHTPAAQPRQCQPPHASVCQMRQCQMRQHHTESPGLGAVPPPVAMHQGRRQAGAHGRRSDAAVAPCH